MKPSEQFKGAKGIRNNHGRLQKGFMPTILIVDDDIAIRKLLERHLRKKQYQVAFAENGREAIKQINYQHIDLVLMDLQMPIMDGISATLAIRESFKPNLLPIIILSAAGDKEKWIRALQAGANDFVSKPYHRSELLARIETNLTLSALTHELIKKEQIAEQELLLAGEVQKAILPQSLDFAGFNIESLYRPSAHLGGDFFDAFEVDNQLITLIGDVSGHGTSAALIMSAAKSLFHSLGHSIKKMDTLLTAVNQHLCEMLGDSGLFITLVLAAFSPDDGKIEFCSAGHNTVFLVRRKQLYPLTSTGTALGWDKKSTWEVTHLQLQSGDLLYLYTDGLVEVKDQMEQQLGLQPLREILALGLSPLELLQKTFQRSQDFCGGNFDDDITIFVVQKI
ncbi:MAG: hypothetical protein COB67_05315 [SAR324 cluster bacterium]|uniref:Response regulatory domain-containing protein n=1 Tax=SAR324 cluster bacterium TaxID=2024889 RepID=A0A2A4T5M0_9DELT|nr:MAG: hypothetical protein COB67_05315 [SAR324 cluster bacterium]